MTLSTFITNLTHSCPRNEERRIDYFTSL